jgi:hypothetical protein
VLELYEVGRQRHPIRLHVIEREPDFLVDLMQIIRLVLHSRQQQSQLRFLVLECHVPFLLRASQRAALLYPHLRMKSHS